MLEDSLIESRISARTAKPLTVLLSTTLHVVIVAALLLVPLFQTLAVPRIDATFLLQPPDPPAPKAIESTVAPSPAVQLKIVPAPADFIAPTIIPSEIAVGVDPGTTPSAPIVHSGMANVGSLLNSIVRNDVEEQAAPPPPPPSAPDAPAPAILRVSGGIQNGNLIYKPSPVYPQLARQARVQGVVLLEAVITEEGTVDSLRLISGHPLLAGAAIEAVRQWRYRPTMLSGQPVPVVTTITVNFSMQ